MNRLTQRDDQGRRKYGIRGDAGGECKTDKREEIQHK